MSTRSSAILVEQVIDGREHEVSLTVRLDGREITVTFAPSHARALAEELDAAAVEPDRCGMPVRGGGICDSYASADGYCAAHHPDAGADAQIDATLEARHG